MHIEKRANGLILNNATLNVSTEGVRILVDGLHQALIERFPDVLERELYLSGVKIEIVYPFKAAA